MRRWRRTAIGGMDASLAAPLPGDEMRALLRHGKAGQVASEACEYTGGEVDLTLFCAREDLTPSHPFNFVKNLGTTAPPGFYVYVSKAASHMQI